MEPDRLIRARALCATLGLLAAVAALLTGCGGGGGTTGATTVAVVKVMPTPELGKVVANSEGMTLYAFHRDNPMLYQFDRDPIPSCYKVCAQVWPPLLSDVPPKATGGAEAHMLGTIMRRDGTTQVTYDGHPLYTFANDERPGETNGDDVHGFGAEWHALEAAGEEVVAAAR